MRKQRRHRKHTLRRRFCYKLKGAIGASAVFIIITALFSTMLYAEDRLAEGAKDITRGVSSLPREIAYTANDTNMLNGIVVGTAKGLLRTIEGIGEGIFKILTFYGEPSQ